MRSSRSWWLHPFDWWAIKLIMDNFKGITRIRQTERENEFHGYVKCENKILLWNGYFDNIDLLSSSVKNWLTVGLFSRGPQKCHNIFVLSHRTLEILLGWDNVYNWLVWTISRERLGSMVLFCVVSYPKQIKRRWQWHFALYTKGSAS